MYGLDPKLVERSMEDRAHELLSEAEADRLRELAGGAPVGQISALGRRLLRQSGQALSTLGSWLEQHGVAGEQPFDGQVNPTV
jgi:hypothetical protein